MLTHNGLLVYRCPFASPASYVKKETVILTRQGRETLKVSERCLPPRMLSDAVVCCGVPSTSLTECTLDYFVCDKAAKAGVLIVLYIRSESGRVSRSLRLRGDSSLVTV